MAVDRVTLEEFKDNLSKLEKRLSDGWYSTVGLHQLHACIDPNVMVIVLLKIDTIEPTGELKVAATWIEFVQVVQDCPSVYLI